MRCDLRTAARAVLGSHQGPALSVAFMPAAAGVSAAPVRPDNQPGPDNQLPTRAISGGADTLIHIWNIESGALETTLRGHSWDVQAVAATPDRVLSACRDSAIYIWNPRTGRHRRADARDSPEHPILATLGPYAISAAPDKTLEIWPHSGGAPVACWPAHFAITAVAAAPDGALLCGDAAGELFHFALVQPDP
jgi:WD40 repeat protein